jgi:hypothetical protein
MKTTDIKGVSVINMDSSRGNTVPNQFIITTPEGRYFQSYASVIAFRSNDGEITLDENKWDFSTTTGKYRNQFLGETKKETQAKIDNGTYQLANLN